MAEICSVVASETNRFWSCKETQNGAQIRTTCVFPSFEPVYVYVAKLGDGFVVHDAGETMAVILGHGQSGEVAKRSIKAECVRYDLSFGKRRISLKIDALDWLETAIVCVANTSASAARSALKESPQKSETDLADTIFSLLEPFVSKGTMVKDFSYRGSSGRGYKFDIAVQGKERLTLIDTVTAHANSVNSKFVAFSDVPEADDVQKIVAHNNELRAEDILLLQNVAVVAGPNGVSNLIGGYERKH